MCVGPVFTERTYADMRSVCVGGSVMHQFPKYCFRCIINCPTASHECGITPSAAAVVSSVCPLGDVSDEPLLNKWGFHTVPGLRSYPVGQALNAESGRPIVICPVLLLSVPIALQFSMRLRLALE